MGWGYSLPVKLITLVLAFQDFDWSKYGVEIRADGSTLIAGRKATAPEADIELELNSVSHSAQNVTRQFVQEAKNNMRLIDVPNILEEAVEGQNIERKKRHITDAVAVSVAAARSATPPGRHYDVPPLPPVV